MSRARTCAAVFAVVAAIACKGPTVPHPMNGENRYTCCNMRYEKPEISDVNYQKGALIPFGTRVQILEVRRDSVKFQPTGHPPMTLVLKYGKDAGLTMEQLLERTFPRDDPHAKLSKQAPKTGKNPKGARPAAADERTRKLIEQGVVEAGMTKEQVLMAKGYPPAHRTPSLESPVWTYWENRWVTSEVYFDGDKVVRVNR